MKLTSDLLEQYFNIQAAIETEANQLVNAWEDIKREIFPEYKKVNFHFVGIDCDAIEFYSDKYSETIYLSIKSLLDPNYESNLRKQFQDEKIKVEERLKRESDERLRYIISSNKKVKMLKLLRETLPDIYKKLEEEAEKS